MSDQNKITLSDEEVTKLKLFLLLHEGDLELKGDKEKIAKVDKLIENSGDILDMVKSKKAAQVFYTFIGSFAKWVAAVIGAIVAYKSLIVGGGGKP